MSLNSDSLAGAMIDAVKTVPDGGAEAMEKLGKAVEDYLVAETAAEYQWIAVNTVPPNEPDSTTSFKAKLSASGGSFSCVPDNFDMFISELSDFLCGIKIEPPSGFTMPPLASGAGKFTADQAGELEDATDAEKAIKTAFLKIADGILAGWKSYFLPASSGMRATYSGAATLGGVS